MKFELIDTGENVVMRLKFRDHEIIETIGYDDTLQISQKVKLFLVEFLRNEEIKKCR